MYIFTCHFLWRILVLSVSENMAYNDLHWNHLRLTGQMPGPAQTFWISLQRWQFAICIFYQLLSWCSYTRSVRTAIVHLLFIIPSHPSSKRGSIIRSQEVYLGCSSRTRGWTRWGHSNFLKLWNFLLFFSTRKQQPLWSRPDPECDALMYWNLFNDCIYFFFMYLFLPFYKVLYLLHRWAMGPAKVNCLRK